MRRSSVAVYPIAMDAGRILRETGIDERACMKRPAVFFDRDNTLIACDGYLGDPVKVELIEGAADAIVRVRELGFRAVVFSNQSGVARGLFPEEAVHAVNHRLDELLHEEDPQAVIDRHDFCPYHPSARIDRYRLDSELRKPKPGMIYQAAQALDLDLPRSWVVGDAPRDIAAGHAAGLRTVLLKIAGLPPSPATDEGGHIAPDFIATSLKEAIDVIQNSRKAPTDNPSTAAKVADSAPATAPAPAAFAEAAATQPAWAPAAWIQTPSIAKTPEQRVAQTSEPLSSIGGAAEAAVAEAPAAAFETHVERPISIAQTHRPTAAEVHAAKESKPSREVTIGAPATGSTPITSSSLNPFEEPVKPTPRSNLGSDSGKPGGSNSSKSGAPKPESAKPVQGGFVVRPNEAPRITWGDRMRMAKQGGASDVGTSNGASSTADGREPEVVPEAPVEEETFTATVETHAEPLTADAGGAMTPPIVGLRREDLADSEPATEPETAIVRTAIEPADSAESVPSPADIATVLDPHAGQDAAPSADVRTDSPGLASTARMEDLLQQVLVELRRREELASLDFSLSKLLAGITQVLALFAMFLAYLAYTNKSGTNDLLPTLLVALTLQTLTISLLIMGKQK